MRKRVCFNIIESQKNAGKQRVPANNPLTLVILELYCDAAIRPV
jgi:hypothetical protein